MIGGLLHATTYPSVFGDMKTMTYGWCDGCIIGLRLTFFDI
jgi:hypothetical protein